MNQPKQWEDVGCCDESRGLVFWHPKTISRYTGRANPPKNGWSMSVDDSSIVNVAYCPFCGKKLSTIMEGIDAKRITAGG